jgi:hypothetical protein
MIHQGVERGRATSTASAKIFHKSALLTALGVVDGLRQDQTGPDAA